MITKLGQVMVYVNDQNEAVKFWRDMMGFIVVAEEDNSHMRWIEVAPTDSVETSIVLHNKEVIAKMQPELNLGTPSLLFFSENLDTMREELVQKGVTVGEIVKMGTNRVFNFADLEENYFAVMEKGK